MKKLTTAIVALVLALPAVAAQTTVKHDFRSAISSEGVSGIIIDLDSADVEVTTGTTSTIETWGTIEKRYRKTTQIGAAQTAVDASEIGIRLTGPRAILEKRFGTGAATRSARADLVYKVHVRVPAGTNVEVRQKNGDIRILGSLGDVIVRLNSGTVSIESPKSRVKEVFARARAGKVTTNLGDRLVSSKGLFAGATHYYNAGGRGTISVMLRFGDIDIVLQ